MQRQMLGDQPARPAPVPPLLVRQDVGRRLSTVIPSERGKVTHVGILVRLDAVVSSSGGRKEQERRHGGSRCQGEGRLHVGPCDGCESRAVTNNADFAFMTGYARAVELWEGALPTCR
jgi:hypothetical protein